MNPLIHRPPTPAEWLIAASIFVAAVIAGILFGKIMDRDLKPIARKPVFSFALTLISVPAILGLIAVFAQFRNGEVSLILRSTSIPLYLDQSPIGAFVTLVFYSALFAYGIGTTMAGATQLIRSWSHKS